MQDEEEEESGLGKSSAISSSCTLSYEPAGLFHEKGVVLEDSFGKGSCLLEHSEPMQLALHVQLTVSAAEFTVPAQR